MKMRITALVLFSSALFAAAPAAAAPAQPVAPVAQKVQPPESAADAALRKAREARAKELEAEAKQKAEAKQARKAARKQAEEARAAAGQSDAKPGDAPVAGDARRGGDVPRAGDAPARPTDARGDAPVPAVDDKLSDLEKESRRPSDAAAAAPEGNEIRRLTREVFKLERQHRERIARIDRLAAVFREQGKTERVVELELMAEQEDRRYKRGFEAYRREMGPEAFAVLETALEVGRERERERPAGDAAQGNGERRAERASDKPRADQRADDQPRRERANGDKPGADNPKAQRPKGDKPNAARPAGDQPARRKSGGNGRGSV